MFPEGTYMTRAPEAELPDEKQFAALPASLNLQFVKIEQVSDKGIDVQVKFAEMVRNCNLACGISGNL
jgi:type II secretory pathway component PulM